MYSNKKTTNFTLTNSQKIEQLKQLIDQSEAIVIGAGAGLSASAGITYSGERFEKNFADFKKKYGIRDMYSGGFYPFETQEEKWAWWARHVTLNRYCESKQLYKSLKNIVKGKNYFVITTNVDHQFQKAKFEKARLFYTQGDYGLFQCSKPCHEKTYDNAEQIKALFKSTKSMAVPTELIPKCPKCGANMSMNLRADDTFVQDNGWYQAKNEYVNFLNQNKSKHILFLELGIGDNTPVIIKYPFWQMTYQNKNATYVSINAQEQAIPKQIEPQSITITADIADIIEKLEK